MLVVFSGRERGKGARQPLRRPRAIYISWEIGVVGAVLIDEK